MSSLKQIFVSMLPLLVTYWKEIISFTSCSNIKPDHFATTSCHASLSSSKRGWAQNSSWGRSEKNWTQSVYYARDATLKDELTGRRVLNYYIFSRSSLDMFTKHLHLTYTVSGIMIYRCMLFEANSYVSKYSLTFFDYHILSPSEFYVMIQCHFILQKKGEIQVRKAG